MASVQRESIGKLHDKIVVTISKEDYYPSFEKTLKQFSKTANVPGFRKGHVPTGMVRKMHGQSIFIDEVLKTANKELESYLKEHNPSIFAQPLPLENTKLNFDMNDTNDMNFEFEIGLKPEFKIPVLDKKGAITRYVIKVDDEMVDQELKHLIQRAGKIEDAEILENENDLAYLDYQLLNEEGAVDESQEKFQDVEEYKDLPKAIAEQLKAKSVGATLTIKPAELLSEEELAAFNKKVVRNEAADKEASYQLTLTKVGIVTPREMNAEFFQEVFPNSGIEDEAAFKVKLKGELGKEVKRLASERIQNELFETLIHETPIELPVDFLKSYIKKNGETLKTDEEVEAEYPSFEHQLRWTLISDQLIVDNKINVSLDEVMADVKQKVMAYFGMSGEDNAEWMDSYLEKMSKDEKTMDETYRRLLFDKLFLKLEEIMDIQDKEVSQEEYTKLPTAHHHH